LSATVFLHLPPSNRRSRCRPPSSCISPVAGTGHGQPSFFLFFFHFIPPPSL
jgi:hypothetical protein